jgi:hypothetical protein
MTAFKCPLHLHNYHILDRCGALKRYINVSSQMELNRVEVQAAVVAEAVEQMIEAVTVVTELKTLPSKTMHPHHQGLKKRRSQWRPPSWYSIPG